MNRTNRPNLMRVARELATYEDPDRFLHALGALLAEHKGTKPPETSKVSDTKDNNQKFNDLLNSCKHPRAVYNVLRALAENGREVQDE